MKEIGLYNLKKNVHILFFTEYLKLQSGLEQSRVSESKNMLHVKTHETAIGLTLYLALI